MMNPATPAIVYRKDYRRADVFVTRSGRQVLLPFFVEPGKLDHTVFALEALKQSGSPGNLFPGQVF